MPMKSPAKERERERERAPVDTSWFSLTTVHDILRRTTSVERAKHGNGDHFKVSKFAHQVEVAKSISEKLWSMPDKHEPAQGSVDKQGNVAPQNSEKPSHKDDGNSPVEPVSSRMDAQLLY